MADNPPATGRPVIGMISMMSPDPSRLAAFWSGLMGLPILTATGLSSLETERPTTEQRPRSGTLPRTPS